jgi:hypothetical protein
MFVAPRFPRRLPIVRVTLRSQDLSRDLAAALSAISNEARVVPARNIGKSDPRASPAELIVRSPLPQLLSSPIL